MLEVIMQLSLFFAKAIIVVVLLLGLLAGIIALLNKGKEKLTGSISIKNLNQRYSETKETLLAEMLPKSLFKKFIKQQTADTKAKNKTAEKHTQKNVFVINFDGDMKASAVAALREEITAVLSVATQADEVVVRLESPGGLVHAYGLAAAQLSRVRDKQIPLTVTVDKVAASGGYLMASVANQILAAPFAIIGSIGVVVQLPNFHRFLKDKHIDFEQLTAGDFKRTLTMFAQNTEEGREKLQQEIEEIHALFKNSIQHYRTQLDIEKISTGEHWLGTQALALKLVDAIKTSDDYLLEKSQDATVYEICFQAKKTLGTKLASVFGMLKREDYSTILLK